MVSFGSPGETTSTDDLEGTLFTLAQVEILDDEVIDRDDEMVVVFLFQESSTRSLDINIVDNDSKF